MKFLDQLSFGANQPDDFFRFTADGIRYSLESSGFKVIEVNTSKSPVESLDAVKETDLDLLKYEYSQGSLEFRKNLCNYYKKHSIHIRYFRHIPSINFSINLTLYRLTSLISVTLEKSHLEISPLN